MSLFKRTNFAKKAFSLGRPEAEAEFHQTSANPSLKNIFIDEIGAIDAIGSGRFIITGRKGTGKSAIVGYIQLNSHPEVDNTSYCSVVKPFIEHSNAFVVPNPSIDFSVLAYEWTIISKLIRMILETGQGEYTPEIRTLKKFYNKYDALFDVDNFLKDSANIKQTMSVNILLGTFNTSFTREIGKKDTEGRPFYSFIPGLYDVIRRILKMQIFEDYEFTILFDDLDVGFNLKEETHRTRILSLIRIAKDINNAPVFNNKVRILLFLRDDVKRNLAGYACDCSKLFGSYEFPINWFEGRNVPEYKLKLKKITNKRLQANFEMRAMTYNQLDPWCSYISVGGRSSSTIFMSLLDYTFYRPRDIINLFLPLDQQPNFELPLDYNDLKNLLKRFAEKIYDEFNDEISILTSEEERNAIKVLIGRLVSMTKNDERLPYIDFLTLIEPPLEASIIETLYGYDVIGIIDNIGDSHYHFRGSFPTVPLKECSICVPNIIRLYFDRSTPIRL